MHASLRKKNNSIALVMWGIIATAVWLFSSPPPLEPILTGGFFGLVVGLLQDRASRVAPEAFRSATFGADVRHALRASPAGRAAFGIHWIAALATIAAAIWVGKPLVGTLGGWALYEFLRRFTILRALFVLNQEADGPGQSVPDSKSNGSPSSNV